jgi:hypothetical protein
VSEQDQNVANEATRAVLDRAGLGTYLFELVTIADGYFVRVEHPQGGVWHRVTLHASRDELLQTLDDTRRRAVLARRWRTKLFARDAA